MRGRVEIDPTITIQHRFVETLFLPLQTRSLCHIFLRKYFSAGHCIATEDTPKSVGLEPTRDE
jgi:hypothetical protein